MAKLYVVGIGPGGREDMTFKAVNAVKESEVIVGYSPYIEYLEELVEGKEIISTGMKGEIERCKAAIKTVEEGRDTAIVSTGDAGLYGMAGPILELVDNIDVEVVPGVTAAFSAAAELGSPIMHDFCSISLSDLLTPWDLIKKRVENAAEADFVITIYNPRSKGRQKHIEEAVEIMLKHKVASTPVGVVKNSGRGGQEKFITTLDNIDYERIDMLTVLIVGNSNTYVEKNQMITPRGYNL